MKPNRSRIKSFLVELMLFLVIGIPLAYIFYDAITKEILLKLIPVAVIASFINVFLFRPPNKKKSA